jgi:hypothetical protein
MSKHRTVSNHIWQNPFSQQRGQITYRPHSIISDPGTVRSVLTLKHTSGKPRYSQNVKGVIFALKA